VTKERQTQIQIALAEEITNTSPKLLTPKMILTDENRNVSLDLEKETTTYFAYAKGKVIGASEQLSEAVMIANEEKGVVVDDDQHYFWKRGHATSRLALKSALENTTGNTTALAQCIAALLETKEVHISVDALLEEGKTTKEILESALKEETVIDLKGVTLEEVEYYISEGIPVIGMCKDGKALLIVGYDSTSVTVYDPELNTTRSGKTEDIQAEFDEAGNLFLTAIPIKN
jgi:hypothetical protein